MLGSTVFPSSVLDDLRTAFVLAAGTNLTIKGVQATDIPAPTASGVLAISVGTASVLNQSGVRIDLTFTAPGGKLEAVIGATMSASWKFSDSFSDLDVFPFQTLSTSNAHFVYATAEQPTYAWPGDSTYPIVLEPGLNFLSDVTLGKFPAITSLLKDLIGSHSYKFYGPFAPNAGQQLPVGTLRAPLAATGTFSVGVPPNALTLDSPAVAVRIGTADVDNPRQRIDLLVLAKFQETLEVAVGIPMTGSRLAISTTPLPNHSSINSPIERLPGGSGFKNYIPAELGEIFKNVVLHNFSMLLDLTEPKVTFLSLSIGTRQPWPIISDVLVLDSLTLKIQTVDPTGLSWTRVFIGAKAQFLPSIFKKGEFDFTVGLEKQTSWEVSTVSGAYYGSVNLGDLVGGLLGNQNSVPPVLRHRVFRFWCQRDQKFAGFALHLQFLRQRRSRFPDLGQRADLATQSGRHPDSDEPQHPSRRRSCHRRRGLLPHARPGQGRFQVKRKLGQITASRLASAILPAQFGWDSMPALPKDLDLGLKEAEFTYDFTGGTIALSADSVNYGKSIFVAVSSTPPSLFTFGVSLPLGVRLANIPLVGSEIPAAQNLGIDTATIWILSRAAKKADVDKVNLIAKTRFPVEPPDQDINAPVVLAADSVLAVTMRCRCWSSSGNRLRRRPGLRAVSRRSRKRARQPEGR